MAYCVCGYRSGNSQMDLEPSRNKNTYSLTRSEPTTCIWNSKRIFTHEWLFLYWSPQSNKNKKVHVHIICVEPLWSNVQGWLQQPNLRITTSKTSTMANGLLVLKAHAGCKERWRQPCLNQQHLQRNLQSVNTAATACTVAAIHSPSNGRIHARNCNGDMNCWRSTHRNCKLPCKCTHWQDGERMTATVPHWSPSSRQPPATVKPARLPQSVP